MTTEENQNINGTITSLSKVITENRIARTPKEHLEILEKWLEIIN